MPMPRKTAEERIGHSNGKKDSTNLGQTVDAGEKVDPPPVNENWHGYVRGWYNALKLSPMAKFYTAGDWMTAIVAAEILNAAYDNGLSYSSGLLKQFNDISIRLLVTEGDRRKQRIELYRASPDADPDEIAAVSTIENWQRKLTAVPDE